MRTRDPKTGKFKSVKDVEPQTFQVGDRVRLRRGYAFPGVSRETGELGKVRVVEGTSVYVDWDKGGHAPFDPHDTDPDFNLSNLELIEPAPESPAPSISELEALTRTQAERIKDMERWHADMKTVEAEWNPQEVAKALDIQLGTSIRPAILPGILALKDRIKELTEQAFTLAVQRDDIQADLEAVHEKLDDIRAVIRVSDLDLPSQSTHDAIKTLLGR